MLSSLGIHENPKLSVILPVFNGQEYLKDALDGILTQSFSNLELIVIDDGSSDGSRELIEKLDDSRVRFFQQPNQGLPITLNRAISHARGEYIARQDQDDVSFPDRLAKQLAFLEANPEVGMVGSWAEIWVGKEKSDRVMQHPTDDASIKFSLLFDNPFVHSSVMIRRSVFEEIGAYCEDKSRQPPEDYELWSRVARKFEMANLPEALMAYREVPGSMSRAGVNPFRSRLIRISGENIACYSGRDVDAPEIVAISRLTHGDYVDLPRGQKFYPMASVLKDAAACIAKEAGGASPQLHGLLKMKLSQLRYHYLEYRTGGWLGKLLAGPVGRCAKRAVKRAMAS